MYPWQPAPAGERLLLLCSSLPELLLWAQPGLLQLCGQGHGTFLLHWRDLITWPLTVLGQP